MTTTMEEEEEQVGVKEERIFVGGLGVSVTEDDLNRLFTGVGGSVHGIDVIRTKNRSFAYVNFLPTSQKSLSKLFATYNGCAWKGGKLKVHKAKEHYLVHMRREWDELEAAQIAAEIKQRKQKETNHEGVKPAAPVNSEKKLRLFFPALRTVKALPFSGSGKHKYSFQRIQEPTFPVHFCDCEEHEVLDGPSPHQSNCLPGHVINDKEITIMNKVMGKLLQKEVDRVPDATQHNTTAAVPPSLPVQQHQEIEEPEEDNGLIINIGSAKQEENIMSALEELRYCKTQVHSNVDAPPSKKRKALIKKNELESEPDIPAGKTDSNKLVSSQPEPGVQQSSAPVLWSQKRSWRQLVGHSDNIGFSVSCVLTGNSTNDNTEPKSGTSDMDDDQDLENQSGSDDQDMENQSSSDDQDLEDQSDWDDQDLENESGSDDQDLENQSGSDDQDLENQSGSDDQDMENQSGSDDQDLENQSGSDDQDLENRSGSDDQDLENQPGSDDQDLENLSGSDYKDLVDQSDSDEQDLENQSGSDEQDLENQSGSDDQVSESQSGSDDQDLENQSGSDDQDSENQSGSDDKPNSGASEVLHSDSDNQNLAKDAILEGQLSQMDPKEENVEPGPQNTPSHSFKSGRGAAWQAKSSWTQLVIDAGSSFSITQVLPADISSKLPGFQYPKGGNVTSLLIKQDKNNLSRGESSSFGRSGKEGDSLPWGSTRKNQQSNTGNGSASAPERGKTCDAQPKQAFTGPDSKAKPGLFVRSADSLNEWAKAKASLSVSRKRKNIDK